MHDIYHWILDLIIVSFSAVGIGKTYYIGIEATIRTWLRLLAMALSFTREATDLLVVGVFLVRSGGRLLVATVQLYIVSMLTSVDRSPI